MKNVNEFIENMVNIEFVDQSNCFGHYPFQMWTKTKDGKNEMAALAIGGDVAACYRAAAGHIKNDAKCVYLSLDFPATGDIKNDFVAVYSYEDKELKCIAIPYDPKTGNLLDRINSSETLSGLMKQFKNFF